MVLTNKIDITTDKRGVRTAKTNVKNIELPKAKTKPTENKCFSLVGFNDAFNTIRLCK